LPVVATDSGVGRGGAAGLFPGATPGVMAFVMTYVGIAPGMNKPRTWGGARND